MGVTGTNGKTTITYLVESALRAAGQTTGLIGTVEERMGAHTRRSSVTTPDAPELHRLLAQMRDADVDTVAMECSSHALEQDRLAGLVYDVVAFTNLTREHLDHHGSMEAYYQAKARLFTPGVARAGVVVIDDPWGRRLAATTRIPIVTLSAAEPGEAASGASSATTGEHPLTPTWRVHSDPGSDDFTLSGPDTLQSLHSPLPGEHNKINTAVAALILQQLGFTPDRARDLLARDVQVPGRRQCLPLGPGAPTAVVDFAHTPDAVAKAASSLRLRTTGRLVITVSAGGGRDPGKREPIGRAAARSGADVLVVTDDHPRHEDPAAIRAAVLRGVHNGVEELHAQGAPAPRVIEVTQGRRRALEVALAAAGSTGTVGFFGLGPDRHQHIGPPGTLVPFVETEEIAGAWQRLVAGSDHPPKSPVLTTGCPPALATPA